MFDSNNNVTYNLLNMSTSPVVYLEWAFFAMLSSYAEVESDFLNEQRHKDGG